MERWACLQNFTVHKGRQLRPPKNFLTVTFSCQVILGPLRSHKLLERWLLKTEPGQHRAPFAIFWLVRQICLLDELLGLIEVQATSAERAIATAGIRFRHGALNIPYSQ